MLNVGPDIIIYPGQSNTCGLGIGPFTDNDASHDNCIFQIGRTGDQNMKIIPAKEPLDFWRNTRHGYCMTFARLYAATLLQPGRSIIIIPAACAETTILQWLGIVPGPRTWRLYRNMSARTNLGLSQGGARMVAWIEQQGEADVNIASTPSDPNYSLMPDAATYQARKLDLVDRVRKDFGIFPMVFGMMSPEWVATKPLAPAFEDAIKAVCDLRPLCAWTDTTGLGSNYDVDPTQNPIHFNAAAQEELAHRHFATYCNMLGLTGSHVSPAVAQARLEAIAQFVPNAEPPA
jgi:hypothetical protein